MKFDTKGRARININTAGDNTIVTGVSGQIIELDHLNFIASGGANTVQIKDGASTIIADYPLTADPLILRAGEGIVFRQADAGSTSDTRICEIDFVWEEE